MTTKPHAYNLATKITRKTVWLKDVGGRKLIYVLGPQGTYILRGRGNNWDESLSDLLIVTFTLFVDEHNLDIPEETPMPHVLDVFQTNRDELLNMFPRKLSQAQPLTESEPIHS